MKLIIAAILIACVCAQVELINDAERVNYVNTHATWTAGFHEMFDGVPLKDAHHFLGLMKRPREYFNMPLLEVPKVQVPDTFDARVQWPGRIIAIRDQAACGSCWAFGATEALSDVFNVHNMQDPTVILSPQQLVSCDTTSYGCQGGYPDKAWDYMAKTGIVPDACYPYSSGGGQTGTCKLSNPKAGDACPSGAGKVVLYHADKQGRIDKAEATIMQAMYSYGPIEMGFHVYADFMNYKSGVYYHVSGALEGGHAIKCLGWGVDDKSKLKYWICANSWGTGWGQSGYFWIKKGTDECGIESWFTTGGQAGKIDK